MLPYSNNISIYINLFVWSVLGQDYQEECQEEYQEECREECREEYQEEYQGEYQEDYREGHHLQSQEDIHQQLKLLNMVRCINNIHFIQLSIMLNYGL